MGCAKNHADADSRRRSEKIERDDIATLAGCALVVLLGWAQFPIVVRIAGALLVVVGLAAATSHEPWAGWTVAAGAGLWLTGSGLHTVKTSTYSSPLARALFDGTALKWTALAALAHTTTGRHDAALTQPERTADEQMPRRVGGAFRF